MTTKSNWSLGADIYRMTTRSSKVVRKVGNIKRFVLNISWEETGARELLVEFTDSLYLGNTALHKCIFMKFYSPHHLNSPYSTWTNTIEYSCIFMIIYTRNIIWIVPTVHEPIRSSIKPHVCVCVSACLLVIIIYLTMILRLQYLVNTTLHILPYNILLKYSYHPRAQHPYMIWERDDDMLVVVLNKSHAMLWQWLVTDVPIGLWYAIIDLPAIEPYVM